MNEADDQRKEKTEAERASPESSNPWLWYLSDSRVIIFPGMFPAIMWTILTFFQHSFFLFIVITKLAQTETLKQISPLPKLVSIMQMWMSPDWSGPKSLTHWRKMSKKIQGRGIWRKIKNMNKALWGRLWSEREHVKFI